mgnify:CR=1 FL=1
MTKNDSSDDILQLNQRLLDFHRFYFDLGAPERARHTTMVDSRVVLLGDDAALLTYVRLVQTQTELGPITQRSEETRVWQRTNGHWRHIHFHRSDNGSGH